MILRGGVFCLRCTCEADERTVWLMFFHGSGPEDGRVHFDSNVSIGLA
ncbi:MAG: hypothetical protein II650_03415 [Clostridia bacterium]|nr:hypothetical protein [Clostridia bacterium]MBQ4350753.1 hypothetical protein [Clostridia bacterium]